ncbi:phage tail terminator-like protein [Rhizobium johnstonii]|uniref:phage tail terminator-like protein n=1 Tax=Rhizobium johnstonii TaxID=3019933 RepID=UPI003F9728D4
MADTVEMNIYQALLVRCQEFAPPAGVTMVLPGVTFAPTAQSKFVSVEVHFNRSIETDLSLVMDPIRQGFMRTNVMWPKGQAIVDGYNLAGQLRAHLRRGTKLLRVDTQVRIDEDPEIGVLVTGETHHNIPVTTRWNCQPQVPA